ncbi:MAG TPA: hypothetical protein PKC18_02740 [Lacipirellulaceae bacterium]|nr:hypothetical protein [Lacipirellulaceae bacterium]
MRLKEKSIDVGLVSPVMEASAVATLGSWSSRGLTHNQALSATVESPE